MRILRIIGKSGLDLWGELFLLSGLSLLWWLAVITIIGGPPATTALAVIGYRLAQEKRVNFDFAKVAFKEHFGISWKLGLVNLIVVVILVVNAMFYLQTDGLLQIAAFFVLYIILAWLGMLMYAFPMIAAMESPRTRDVLRNAAIIAFANPIFSLVIVLILGIITAISVAVPVLALLVLPAFLSIAAARALADRLELAEEKRKREIQ